MNNITLYQFLKVLTDDSYENIIIYYDCYDSMMLKDFLDQFDSKDFIIDYITYSYFECECFDVHVKLI